MNYENTSLPSMLRRLGNATSSQQAFPRKGDGSEPEILSRIAQTTAALTRLKPVWIDKSISLSSKIRLMRSLVTSIFLYACQTWTPTAELQRRIQAMEMWSARYYTSDTKTMLPTRKSVPRSSRQLDHMKISVSYTHLTLPTRRTV